MIALAAAVALTAAAPTPRDLVVTNDISSLALSPDGRLLAFRVEQPSVERNDTALSWYVVQTPQGVVWKIADGGEAIVQDPGVLRSEPPKWSAASDRFYYRKVGTDGVQVWRARIGGEDDERMTDDPADVIDFTVRPDALLYRVGATRLAIRRAETAEYESGIRIDQSVDLVQTLFRGGLVNGRPATQRFAGKWFERVGLLADTPLQQRRLDLATRRISNASAEPSAVNGAVPTNSVGDRATIVADGHGLVVTRVDGARITFVDDCTNDRIIALVWRPGHDALVVTSQNAALAQSLWLFDVGAGRMRLVTKSDGLLSGGRQEALPCAISQDAAYCVTASPASPPRLERIELETGARRVLHDPNPRLRASPLRVEPITWSDQRGQRFTGVLFHPIGNSPAALFINYYRCSGFIRGGLGDEFPFAALAANGIAALCVNQLPRTKEDHDAVDAYRRGVRGVTAAVKMLSDQGLIDARAVGMGGLSFGSEVTTWTLMTTELLSAASIASTQLEPAYYWFNGIAGRTNHAMLKEAWRLGAPDQTPARWRKISPALNSKRIRAPLLMQLPETEARLTIELFARLTTPPTPTELYAFPDEPHIKAQPRHKLAVYERNLDWFRFWLLSAVDSNPEKGQQYERWRALAARRQPAQLRSQSSRFASSNSRK